MDRHDRSGEGIDEKTATIARRTILGTIAVASAGGLASAILAGTGIARPAVAAQLPSPTPTPVPTHDGHVAQATTRPTATPMDHDANAEAAVKRFIDGEWQKVTPYGTAPLNGRLEGGARVFDMTIDAISHRIDALKPPVKALGYNGTWPGPTLRVTEGELVRATFTNRMDESTGVHFHGQRLPNAMDGVPLVTQPPIMPGKTFMYEFVARTPGSHMYHSHHNATDQVGRGLLGAFIVDPKDPAERPAAKYGVTQDIIWISNDTLGGFTINGRGFPATRPITAKLGERIYIRFMNEGVMMHPWHLHGMPMRVVARDGYPLGPAAFTCDTIGVNPGERWDVVVECDEPGVWAFHCHILPHAEGRDGMFGMVTALIVS